MWVSGKEVDHGVTLQLGEGRYLSSSFTRKFGFIYKGVPTEGKSPKVYSSFLILSIVCVIERNLVCVWR
jgi:hypothetical protein